MIRRAFLPEYDLLPETVQAILKHVVVYTEPDHIVLFGSRARGSNRANSDYDFAVAGVSDREKWAKLIVDLEELSISLHAVDLVLFEELGDDYKCRIKSEGRAIYG